jgi:transcriptional regulator with XRE-family HTH domain
MVLLRHEVGDVMRDFRLKRGMTLRDVASSSSVSLSYLSDLERGQKEASSEILLSIAGALSVPLSELLHEVADRLALFEEFVPETLVPDTVPEEFFAEHVHE